MGRATRQDGSWQHYTATPSGGSACSATAPGHPRLVEPQAQLFVLAGHLVPVVTQGAGASEGAATDRLVLVLLSEFDLVRDLGGGTEVPAGTLEDLAVEVD